VNRSYYLRAEERDRIVSKLHALLSRYMLRRTKEDVMKSLPAKHEVVVPVGLTPVQAELYRLVLNKNYELLRMGLGVGAKHKATLTKARRR
jgi:SNF2 family DNA or RNA helicase